ncbi:hypothetical protein KEM56_004815 [Ascosphaera pollenicola]|nr:hypothetical protein KEM56_004815 [Ascosphaera pollenicola]
MSILAGAPLVYIHGMDGAKWAQILRLSMAWDGVFGGSLGVLVGAWLGAVPVPLDWCPGIHGKKIRFDDEKVEEKTA